MDATGSQKNFYRDPLIAMAFFAVLFFILLVVIVVLWCIKRRQTEVKTVEIVPKRRPITKSTKQANGGAQHSNGNADVEVGITADEIELSDDQDETTNDREGPKTEEPVKTGNTSDNDDDVSPVLESANRENSEEQGEVNPSFEKGDEEAPAS